MLSRVADSLYWMSRYLERAEHTARLVAVQLNLMVEQPAEINAGRWPRVYEALGINPAPPPEMELLRIVDEVCFDPGSRSSIVSAIMAARDNARQVREEISSEMWEQLNRLYHHVRSGSVPEQYESDPSEFLASVIEGSHLFQGLTDSTMSHGEGWHFIQFGRHLERALGIASLLRSHYRHFHYVPEDPYDAEPNPLDYPEWIGLLKAATAFEAYCKIFTPTIHTRQVANFLLLDGVFPHSLRYSIERMNDSLTVIGEVSPSRRGSRALRLAGRLRAMLGFAQIDEILGAGLEQTLDDLRRECLQIHDGGYQAFITYPVEVALEA